MGHKELIQDADNALRRLYSDVSVDRATTLEDLELIIEDLNIMCEALRNAIESENIELSDRGD